MESRRLRHRQLGDASWIPARTSPDGPPNNDPEAIEARIALEAARFRRRDPRRDSSGRFVCDHGPRERNVRLYLTSVAFGGTLSELALAFGLKTKGAASRAYAAGQKLVEAARNERRL